MRKSELGAWSRRRWGAVALLLAACGSEPVGRSAPRPSGAAAPAGPAPDAAVADVARFPEADERVLPVVPVAAKLCDALAAASASPSRSEAAGAMLAAERAACAGEVAAAVGHWQRLATLEPRLGDITNRRIAQVTGGGRRGGANVQTLAGALTVANFDHDGPASLPRDDAWLFALEPAPWVRSRVDGLRWQRVLAAPEAPSALAWARRWLAETDGGDGNLWLERFGALREQSTLKPADRLLLSGRCVDRFVGAEERPLTPVARRRLMAVVERCFGASPAAEGLSGDGSVAWALGEVSEADVLGGELAARESQWQSLRDNRRRDFDGEALALAELLGEQALAWRGAEALLACVQLGESLGESVRAERCLTALSGVATTLSWDVGQRYEVAMQRALRSGTNAAGMEAIAATGDEATGTRRRFVEARSAATTAGLRSLIAEAPLSYEAVFSDRLLRSDGGAGDLASKLASLRYATPVSAPHDAGWAAEWLAEQGFVSQARSEALLQAEVEGSLNPRLWGLAADLLARNGEFALAHSAARKLTASLGAFAHVTPAIPGRVWRDAYPLLWEKEVAAASERHGVPKSLLLAFMRRESGFDAQARSSVGARGLMQVLPDTAREVAARHGISMARGLGDPGLNLEIAAAMLSDLLQEFEGRTEVVAAAYSAGPAKARRWVRDLDGADLWLWTEAIPYDVVRSYAREVSVSAAVYAAWLGEPPPAPHVVIRRKR